MKKNYYTSSDLNEIINLRRDLDRVVQWMENSRLVLNYSKTKVILFETKQKIGHVADFSIKIQGDLIERLTEFIYLGVLLDEQLTWKEHT